MAESSDSNEVTFRMSRNRRSVPRSRAALHTVLSDWRVGQEVLETAESVLLELVTNALRVQVPRYRQVSVRIMRLLEDGLLRLKVSDAGPGWPEMRVPAVDETGGRGLLLVEALAHCWGVVERESGIGKTVWAELKAPDIVAEPEEREVAAVLVRAGQCVRVWGQWHVVRSVCTGPYATGGLAVVFGLDDGPALRVRGRAVHGPGRWRAVAA